MYLRQSLPYLFCKSIFILLLLLVSLSTMSQETIIRGRVRHWNGNDWLGQANILLLTRDSTLLESVRTQRDGKFLLRISAKDSSLLLMVTHPNSEPYIRTIVVGIGPIDLGSINISPAIQSLTEVVVTSREVRPHIKGDTLEYNTRNIQLNQNASVEELLRGLPGVTVDPNGNIYVNGQKVDHLLIDGEDFFGAHLGMATKSLTADMIAKVQLFERRSDIAEFTGVDDGNKEKTLNLQLKEEKKGGFFGNLAYGADDQGFYNGGGMIASFKGKRQIALLGLADNTGPASVNSAGLTEGGLVGMGIPADPMGASAGAGVPKIVAMGAHYADTWKENDQHLVGNYQYGRLTTRPWTSIVSIQNLVDTTYLLKQKSSSINQGQQQNFTGRYNMRLDSLYAILINATGNISSGNNKLSSTDTSAFNQHLVNSSLRSVQSLVNNRSFNGDFLFRIQNAKDKGRSFSIGTGIQSSNNSSSGYLYQSNRFYDNNDGLLSTDTIDQKKLLTTSSVEWNSMLFFHQQLKGADRIDAHIGYSATTASNKQYVYNPGNGHYNTIVDSISSDYHLKLTTPSGGVDWQHQIGSFVYSIALDLAYPHFHQTDVLHPIPLDYGYFNFNPRFMSNYRLNPTQYVHLGYEGSSQQPTPAQLQPVTNNNDPLHISIGNPGLHASYTHKGEVIFYSTRRLSLTLNLSFHLSSNDIGSRTTTDSLGRQITQFVNIIGAKGTDLGFNFSRNLGRSGFDLGFNLASSYNKSYIYIGNVLNANSIFTSDESITVSKYIANKWNFRCTIGGAWYYDRSSVNVSNPTKYWTQHHVLDAGHFLFWGIEIHSDLDYSWRQKTGPFDTNNTIWNWNAWMNKNILKNKVTLRWSITNILNQNTGITRTIALNQTSQTATNVLRRCWLFTATWRFEHKK